MIFVLLAVSSSVHPLSNSEVNFFSQIDLVSEFIALQLQSKSIACSLLTLKGGNDVTQHMLIDSNKKPLVDVLYNTHVHYLLYLTLI